MLVQRKGRRAKAPVYETSLDFRCHWDDYFLVVAAAYYERREMAELLRQWLNEKRREYRRDSSFKKWLRRHEEDLKAKAIQVERIL